MSDILSQSEIDNLLKQLSDGDLDVDQIQGEDEKQVKNYDFSRPTKFSKEHLRTLEIIFEHYSRLVSTNLPVYLRKNVQVSVASSETVTFSEFSNALSNPSVLGIINFAPLNGNIIIEIATNLCYAMLDRVTMAIISLGAITCANWGFVSSLLKTGEISTTFFQGSRNNWVNITNNFCNIVSSISENSLLFSKGCPLPPSIRSSMA